MVPKIQRRNGQGLPVVKRKKDEIKEKNVSTYPCQRKGWQRQPTAEGEDYSVQPDPKGYAIMSCTRR